MWYDKAVCKGKTELFFAAPSERPPQRAARETMARQLCAICPVSGECFEASAGEFGFWAGTTEEDRGFKMSDAKGVFRFAEDVPVQLNCEYDEV